MKYRSKRKMWERTTKRRMGKEEDIMKEKCFLNALDMKRLKTKILRYGLKTPATMTRDFTSLQKYRVARVIITRFNDSLKVYIIFSTKELILM
jgi:hypothetical protein